MTSLPKFDYRGTSYQLPAVQDIVDKANPLQANHQFRPIQDLTQTMHDYALACANQIETIAQQRLVNHTLESKCGKTYKRLDHKNPQAQYWKIEKADDSSTELKYTIAASKANGAWEKLVVYKDPNAEDITKASWQINGFLPGRINLQQKQNQWKAFLHGPNLNLLKESNSKNLRNNHSLLRLHHVLTSQAQCLLDWNREYGMNGCGIKIGGYKFLVRQLNGNSKAKAYILTRDSNFSKPEKANAFIVKTNSEGKITEIIQDSKHSDHALRLIPRSDDIFKEAKLLVTNKKAKEKALEDIDITTEVAKLLRGSVEENKLTDELQRVSEQFRNCEQEYSIKVPLGNEGAKKAKETLLQVRNLNILGKKLHLLVRPEVDLHNDRLNSFYTYTGLRPGQISFAFYSNKVNSTRIFGNKDERKKLASFGPIDLRRRFYTSRDSQYIIQGHDLENFMTAIGISVTSEDQNKAIYRWALLNNEEVLNQLGIYVQRNPGSQEILHRVCPLGKNLLKEFKINIPIGLNDSYKVPIVGFPAKSVIKKLHDTLGIKINRREKFEFANTMMFYRFLEEIGFKLASRNETERFIQETLTSDNAKKMKDFLETRRKLKPGVYKTELAAYFLEEHLRNQGYTDIEEVSKNLRGRNSVIVFRCSKDGTNYLARALVDLDNLNLTNKRSNIQKLAEEENRTPLLFLIKGMDLAKRQYSGISELNINSKQYKYHNSQQVPLAAKLN